MVKQEMTSGPFQGTLFTVITWNPESNCSFREKRHSQCHWNFSTWPGLQVRHWMKCWRNFRRLLERWWRSRIDRFYKVHDIGWKTTRWEYLVRGETDKKANDLNSGQIMARDVETYVWCIKTWREAKVGYWETKARQCPKITWNLFHWFWKRWIQAFYENARSKLDIPMPAAMPCKTSLCRSSGETCSTIGEHKTKYAWVEIMGKTWENTGMNFDESQKQNGSNCRSKEKGHISSFCVVDRSLLSQEFGVGTAISKIQKVESCSEEILWKMIQTLTQYLLNQDHQLHKWRLRHNGLISRLVGCAGQAADALSAYTQVKMEDAPTLLKIPKSECPDIWIRLPRHRMAATMVQYGRSSRSSWAKSVRSPFSQDCCGKGNLRKSYCSTVGRRFPTGNAYSYTVKKDYSYLRMWMTSNWLESNETLIRCGKYSIKKSIGRTNIIPWSCILGVHSKTMPNMQRYCWQLQSHVWITNFRRSNWKITTLGTSSYFFMALW